MIILWPAMRGMILSGGVRWHQTETPHEYQVHAFDEGVVYTTTIYRTGVPDNIPISEASNAEHLADFEQNFKTVPWKPGTIRAADGKAIVLPNIFPGEVILNFAGRGDSVSPAVRGAGPLFGLKQAGAGSQSMNIEFLDGIFIAGGHVRWEGGNWGSSIALDITAPASTVKAPAVEGQGNCNLIPVGVGINMLIPAAGDGAYDLDYAVPIPSINNESNATTGFWEYSEPWVGKGVMSPGIPTKAKYNLFDIPLTLSKLCTIHLGFAVGCQELSLPALKPKWILPEWSLRVTLDNVGDGELAATWSLTLARKRTI